MGRPPVSDGRSGITLGVRAALVIAALVPVSWHARDNPAWYRAALCIHAHESGDWHIHNEPYANGFQFTLGTWERAGGAASSWISATPREQMYRAWRIWRADGGSWREWPTTSRICGVR